MTDLAAGYYAATDPDDPGIVTCWRWSATGRRRGFQRWSGGALYGVPTRPSRGRPPRPWTDEVRRAGGAWLDDVFGTIRADPARAARLFASVTGSCYSCGRRLTDPQSVARGIGPDCAGLR